MINLEIFLNRYARFVRCYREMRKDGFFNFIKTKNPLGRVVAKYHTTKIYWHPRRLYRKKNALAIKEPIFLLGVQGGGLTLISRVIRLLPNIVYISGNNKFWAGPDELHNDRRFKYFPDQLALRSPGYFNLLGHEKQHPDFGTERAFLYATDEFLNEYRLDESDWTPELEYSLKDAIRQCLCVYAKDIHRAQFHDMSQSYTLKIPFLKRCFPDAKFIIASRDPYAACWKQAQNSPIFHKDRYRAVRLAAEHWFNTYKYALQDTKNCHDTLLLRFEDFLLDWIAVSKKIYRFLDGPNIDAKDLFNRYKSVPIGSSAPKKWLPINFDVNKNHHEKIPEWACDIITQKCHELITLFQYELPDNHPEKQLFL